ncbi:hypothetical protein ACOTTU_23365 [Roseobacter sp. EG26]|uniref:hypothetical protein n=1 Tax=Roseobacter sp. EG26 TaxID=3412477 RepID=UPI003CE46C09
MSDRSKDIGGRDRGGQNPISGSPIAMALLESEGFLYQLGNTNSDTPESIGHEMMNQWYILLRDGRTVEGIVDAAKDVRGLVVVRNEGDEWHPDINEKPSSIPPFAVSPPVEKPFSVPLEEVDVFDVEILKNTIEFQGKSDDEIEQNINYFLAPNGDQVKVIANTSDIHRRFVVIFTHDGNLEEINDPEISYIEVSGEADPLLIANYLELRELSGRAASEIEARLQRFSLHQGTLD